MQVEYTGGDIGIPEGEVEVGMGHQDPNLGNLTEDITVSPAGLQRILIESRLDQCDIDAHAVQHAGRGQSLEGRADHFAAEAVATK